MKIYSFRFCLFRWMIEGWFMGHMLGRWARPLVPATHAAELTFIHLQREMGP